MTKSREDSMETRRGSPPRHTKAQSSQKITSNFLPWQQNITWPQVIEAFYLGELADTVKLNIDNPIA